MNYKRWWWWSIVYNGRRCKNPSETDDQIFKPIQLIEFHERTFAVVRNTLCLILMCVYIYIYSVHVSFYGLCLCVITHTHTGRRSSFIGGVNGIDHPVPPLSRYSSQSLCVTCECVQNKHGFGWRGVKWVDGKRGKTFAPLSVIKFQTFTAALDMCVYTPCTTGLLKCKYLSI